MFAVEAKPKGSIQNLWRHWFTDTPSPPRTHRPTHQVIEQAAYMQRYGAAAAAPTSGRAIGEVTAHHRLAHAADPAILPLLEAMADERCICMVFPYADGPDAFDAVAATPRGLPEAEARRYFIDMALGVLHLKKHGVSHGCVACLRRLLN